LEYQFDVETLKHLVLHKSKFSFLKYPIGADGVVSFATLMRYDRATAEGSAMDLGALRHYVDSGHKLLIYHGYADMAISPYSTIDLYRKLNDPAAVLFMIPNMGHCGGGGAPDQFDTLGLLEDWTEKAQQPGSILAVSKEVPTKTMLICQYPKEARQSKPETGAATASECITP
jgi:feruloyl esterase